MDRHPRRKRLVIGIGNPLRGDDGVGTWLAEQAAVLTAAEPDGPVAVRSVQQLTPELAEELAQLEDVLFIDAWQAPAKAAPQLLAIGPAAGAATSHRLEPAQLLAVSQALFGRMPRAHLLQVPAHAFPHGMELSQELEATLPAARALLQAWLSPDA
jgi:hydrogenase maturation protease